MRVARPIDRHRDRRGIELWTFDADAQNKDLYASRDMVDPSSNLIRHKPLEEDPDYTVSAIRANGIYATDTARRNEVIEAAKQTIRNRALKPANRLQVYDTPGEAREDRGASGPSYTILVADSPLYLVYDPTRPIRVQRSRVNMHSRSMPSTEELLQRPLQQYYILPDDVFRPYDLAPASIKYSGQCVVNMIYDRYTVRKRKGRRGCQVRGDPEPAKTIEEIQMMMDRIWVRLGYEKDAFPYPHG